MHMRMQLHADLIDPGDDARIAADLGMLLVFDRGHELEFRIGAGQGDQPLAHASRGTVDGEMEFGHRLPLGYVEV